MEIEIYPHTIDKYVTWYEAKELCLTLDDRWRLPTLEELNYMYDLSREGKISLGNYGCWGKMYNDEWAWSKGFHTGNTYLNPLDNLNLLRPVRDIIL